MKNGSVIQTDLRLVGVETSPWQHASDHNERSPNLLQPYDPRWVFAVRASQEINRSPHPILLTEPRERIIRHAQGMGLTRFDALAIIAIVAGEAAAGRNSLGPDIENRLAHIGSPPNTSESIRGVPLALAAIVITLIMGAFAYFTMIR